MNEVDLGHSADVVTDCGQISDEEVRKKGRR